MTQQEEKELLLKDLCARLPYGVKGRVYAETTNGEYDITGDMIFFDSTFDVTLDSINTSTGEIHVVAIGNEDTVDFIEDQQVNGTPYTIDDFKPYLRPMPSMTKEEDMQFAMLQAVSSKSEFLYAANAANMADFLNANHFDYRGLIPRGLALEAPEGMYKTK